MLKSRIKYSVIIPFHGNRDYLDILLQSIGNPFDGDFELIIVTNSKLELEGQPQVLITEKTLTYPEAINSAVEIARGEFLIFCDSDCYLLPESLEKLAFFYHSNDKVGIASSKLICPFTGVILDFGICFNNYNSPHIGRGRVTTFPLFNNNRKVQAACSATMIIKKEIFTKLNGFNELLSFSYCDLDLCLRLKELDKEIWVVANSLVFHRGNSSNSNLYKNDVKGRFWALNAHRITIDMDSFFKESFTFFESANAYQFKSYFLIDLSTVVDWEWHYRIFTKELNLRITDVYKYPISERDANHIPLYGLLSWNILKLRYPIIYFVDRFTGLFNNHLWWYLRNYKEDLVIDRNGNIDNIVNILSNE